MGGCSGSGSVLPHVVAELSDSLCRCAASGLCKDRADGRWGRREETGKAVLSLSPRYDTVPRSVPKRMVGIYGLFAEFGRGEIEEGMSY